MTSHQTGHAEIDEQHTILENMVAQLLDFCSEASKNQHVKCQQCNVTKQQRCTETLGTTIKNLTVFLVGHSTYEERMMDLLPPTPTCHAHVKLHKAAHEAISRRLKKLSLQIGAENPRDASIMLWRVIYEWMGSHLLQFDDHLIRLSKSCSSEIDFDSELVAMLDLYVFPNRPTMAKSTVFSRLEIQKKKLEARGRFESLSAAQRKIFWLVVSGKKNKEIADEIGVTVNTIKTHRAAIFQKMAVSSAIELIKTTDMLRPISS